MFWSFEFLSLDIVFPLKRDASIFEFVSVTEPSRWPLPGAFLKPPPLVVVGDHAKNSERIRLIPFFHASLFKKVFNAVLASGFRRKKRQTASFYHPDAQLEITEQGVEVRSKFEGREGIMSGSPRRMADSFVEAFVKR